MGLLTITVAHPGQSTVDIQIKEAWIRLLPANLPAAGYMTVINTGSATCTLVGATSPDYGEVSFHQTRNNNGMTEMTPVESIALTPQVPVHFAPGGYHLMLMQPKRSLQPGDRVLITFRLAKGQSIEVPFEVRAPNSP